MITHIPRLELLSMSFDNTPRDDSDSDSYGHSDSDSDIDIDGDRQSPPTVCISDGARLQEIYNPEKVNGFYSLLPEEYRQKRSIKQRMGDSISGHTVLSLTCPPVEVMQYPALSECSHNYEEESSDPASCKGCKRKWCDLMSPPTDLPPLTSPNANIVPYDSFSAMVPHDGNNLRDSLDLDCNPKLNGFKSRLPLTGPHADIVPFDNFDVIIRRRDGSTKDNDDPNGRVILDDLVSNWEAVWPYSYNHPFNRTICWRFGKLTLRCILYHGSRLVTVGLKWHGQGIIGVAAKTFICGKVSFYNSKFKDLTSSLLDTPKDKAVIVADDNSIPLLRSAVAVPSDSGFTVDVSLEDPSNKLAVNNRVFFEFDEFSEELGFKASKDINGTSANIQVEVTMKPNDVHDLLFGPTVPRRV